MLYPLEVSVGLTKDQREVLVRRALENTNQGAVGEMVRVTA